MRGTPEGAHRPDRLRGDGGSVAGTLAGILGGVLTFLVIVLGLLWFGYDWGDESAEPPLSASPLPTTPAPVRTTTEPEAAPTTPGDTPAPTAGETTPEPTAREPTDSDAAAFTSAFEPPGGRDADFVTVDLTGDDRPEILVVSIADGAVRLDIATWTGTAYEVTFTDVGGPAETIDRFTVRDVTGDGTRDITTLQLAGEDRQNLAMWGWDGEQFHRHVAEGGCWDGTHVYGIVGVALYDGEVAATCDGSPEPVSAWPTDVYVWEDGAWRYDRTVEP